MVKNKSVLYLHTGKGFGIPIDYSPKAGWQRGLPCEGTRCLGLNIDKIKTRTTIRTAGSLATSGFPAFCPNVRVI